MKKILVTCLAILIALPSIVFTFLKGISYSFQLVLKFKYWILFVIVVSLFLLSLHIIRKNYRPLSYDSKSSFWQILTNIFLVFFTFWMGIYVQDLVASKNAEVNRRLLSFEYVDRIFPVYEKIINDELYREMAELVEIDMVYSRELTKDSTLLLSLKDEDTIKKDSLINQIDLYKGIIDRNIEQLSYNLRKQEKEIISLSKVHDSIMGSYKFYLDSITFYRIMKISVERNRLVAILELLADSTLIEQAANSALFEPIITGDSVTNFYSKELAYFENFLLHSESLTSVGLGGNIIAQAITGYKDYSEAKIDSTKHNHLLANLVQYLIEDVRIMEHELSYSRGNPSTSNPFKKSGYDAITIFGIFLMLSFFVGGFIVWIISPLNIKSTIDKDKYNKLENDYELLITRNNQKDIELSRKRTECKELEREKANLTRQIQELDNRIKELDGQISVLKSRELNMNCGTDNEETASKEVSIIVSDIDCDINGCKLQDGCVRSDDENPTETHDEMEI